MGCQAQTHGIPWRTNGTAISLGGTRKTENPALMDAAATRNSIRVYEGFGFEAWDQRRPIYNTLLRG